MACVAVILDSTGCTSRAVRKTADRVCHTVDGAAEQEKREKDL